MKKNKSKNNKKVNNPKIGALIIATLVIAVAFIGLYFLINGAPNSNKANNGNKKVAVVYFSATGTTKKVAKVISKETGGALFEIEPKVKYTEADLDRNDLKSRAVLEYYDPKSRPEIANNIDIDEYDVIYLGYPIWCGEVPRIILTFMDKHNLDGKTIIPFATSESSGITQSASTLKDYNKKVKWIKGQILNGSENDIKNWVKSISY